MTAQQTGNMITMKTTLILVFGALIIICGSVQAQQFVYPNDGQTPEQQQTDEGECYVWAKGQTGYDHANPPQVATTAPPETGRRGGVVRGAVVGAAVGEIVDDDAGKGAAAGAVLGGARQRRQSNEAQEQYQQSVNSANANADQQRDTYNRAYVACMEGRHYTIK